MYDVFHEWGSDLLISSSGDLGLASGSDMTSQRVRRRLLTNPGEYIWNLDYGGGLGQFVGLPARPAEVEAVIMSQLLLEAAIPAVPPPQVTTAVVDAANGYFVANITFADSTLQQTVALNVSTG